MYGLRISSWMLGLRTMNPRESKTEWIDLEYYLNIDCIFPVPVHNKILAILIILVLG